MGYKKIPTKDLTRLEWLELRREGIGGSDASVVMGENPYRSILQLWEEKTGRKEITDEGNEHTYWGTLMEDVIRHEFMNRTGLKVRQKHFMIFHPEYPYLFADVDGIVTDENGEKCIFEAKTASQYREREWQDGGIPKEYQLQVQHYLAVCGLKRAYIAVLIGGNHFLYYQVERDEEMIEKLLEAEKDFWEAHVLADVPPVPDDSKATSKYLDEKYSDPVEDIVRLDAEMEKVIEEYQAIARQIKEMEKHKNGLSNQIKAVLGKHEEGKTEEGRTVSWKKIEKTAFNEKELKKEKPEIWSQYAGSTSYRLFKVA